MNPPEFCWNAKKYVNPITGVPQGGIVSPILSNLVLHELDKFMQAEKTRLEMNNAGRRPHIVNPKYHKLTMRINRLKPKIDKAS
jgi:retron-type reverse transcriptase